MRALCGAIITTGALIGLGLNSLGLAIRYQDINVRTNEKLAYVRFSELDTGLMANLIVLMLAVLVGLGLTILGLAYHHERRLHERAHHLSKMSGTPVNP